MRIRFAGPKRHLRELRSAVEEPISFSEYMTQVLYGSSGSYYRTNLPGSDETYYTSPSLSPWFGRLVCRALEQMHRALADPPTFTVTEWGAGDASLAAACVEAALDHLRKALRWRFVEPFEEVASVQKQRLSAIGLPAEWFGSESALEPVEGCVLANEVVDNLPFDVFEVTDAGPAEIKVVANEGVLTEVRCEPSGELPEQALEASAVLSVGDRFEIRKGLDSFVASISQSLTRGFLAIFDYGDVQPQIWTKRPAGTLVTYGGGSLGVDPFETPGLRDITAHVDFTQLSQICEREGFSDITLVSQREFLKQLGAEEEIDRLRQDSTASALAERSRLAALLQPGLGDLTVLLAAKAAGPFW